MATKGLAASEVETTYTRAWALCQQLGDVPQRYWVLRGLWNVSLLRGEMQSAHELAAQLLPPAQARQEAAVLVEAHLMLGETCYFRGEFVPALDHVEQGMARRDPQKQRSTHALQDPDVGCLLYAGRTLWPLGYPDQALARSDEALALAQRLAHPYSIMASQYFTAAVHQHRRESRAAQELAEAAMARARDQGFPLWLATGTLTRGWALVQHGQVEEGMAQMQQGLAAWRATGARIGQSAFDVSLAEAYGQTGQAEEGLRVLAEALREVDRGGERRFEAELHRLKGNLLLTCAADKDAEAETCFHQALALARHQQAKSLELRAATSLARLWQSQGKRQDASDLLAPVYGWFTEGFDTADLKEAKVLLEELEEGWS
jgi:predicted ATPase